MAVAQSNECQIWFGSAPSRAYLGQSKVFILGTNQFSHQWSDLRAIWEQMGNLNITIVLLMSFVTRDLWPSLCFTLISFSPEAYAVSLQKCTCSVNCWMHIGIGLDFLRKYQEEPEINGRRVLRKDEMTGKLPWHNGALKSEIQLGGFKFLNWWAEENILCNFTCEHFAMGRYLHDLENKGT